MSDMQVGSTVRVTSRTHDRLGRITRETKTTWVVCYLDTLTMEVVSHEFRYRKDTNRLTPEPSRWYSSRIESVTAFQINEFRNSKKRSIMALALRNADWNKVPLETLIAIHDLLPKAPDNA